MKLHHIGYVVRDINRFAGALPGLTFVRRVFDPVQQAELALYQDEAGFLFEFIEPQTSNSFTWAHLERAGESYHHVCFEAGSEGELNEAVKKKRLLKIRGPIPAILFSRNVIFTVARNRNIIEFLL